MPSTLNGTNLCVQEFWDVLLLYYVQSSGDLPSHCDGCGTAFSIWHALECKTGGLIILQHNKITKELCDLASKVLMAPSAILNKLMMVHPRGIASEDTNNAEDPKSPI
jgi:hypothetical protein